MGGTASVDQFLTDLKVGMTDTTVTIDTGSTTDAYGERTFTGSTTSYDARVEQTSVVIRNNRDEDVVSEFVAYIPDNSLTLTVNDQISMPVVGVRPIIKVEYRTDDLGKKAVVAFIGR